MLNLRSLAVVLLAAAVAPAAAQSRALDEGTFVVTRAGAPLGTESFQVTRVGGERGQMIRVTAQRSVGDQRIVSSLTADSMGTPLMYSVTVKDGHGGELVLNAAGAPGRLSSVSHDQKSNESMKEYVVVPGSTVILDEDLVHQYYFVALRRHGGSVKVIVPRTSREVSATLAPGGMESIDVGGRSTTATKYTLTGGGGAGGREFWVDAAGRLLRVALPGGVVATREELPR